MTDLHAPQITFLLVAYNQVRWIGEALAGAFSQTYSPLEIFINDDGSTDGTQEIIREAVANYRGPHSIRVNLNAVNIGLLPSLNLAFRSASGSFIVVAAGDDISGPDRVQVIVDAIAASKQQVYAVVSDSIAMDETGRDVGYINTYLPEGELSAESLAERGGYINGAAAGYARELIGSFNDLETKIWSEDSILPFRAALLGRVLHIPKPLLRRRIHHGSLSSGAESREGLLRQMRPAIHAFSARLTDIDNPRVRQNFGEDGVTKLRQAIARSIERQKCMIALVEGRPGATVTLLGAVRRGLITPLAAAKAILMYRLTPFWRAYCMVSGYMRRRNGAFQVNR